jgi:hypothetical protein
MARETSAGDDYNTSKQEARKFTLNQELRKRLKSLRFFPKLTENAHSDPLMTKYDKVVFKLFEVEERRGCTSYTETTQNDEVRRQTKPRWE